MDNVVFTSDTHAYHDNIIKYSGRPFTNSHDMSLELADNINKSLPSGGLVYHLGDWSMGPIDNAFKFKEMINKNIEFVLVIGNHDKHKLKNPLFTSMFKKVSDLLEVHVNGKRITLCHYAMKLWDKCHHGAWHLYGHSHNALADDPNSLSIDVGVDAAAARFGVYRPFTFPEIADIMSRKTFKALDHHGATP